MHINRTILDLATLYATLTIFETMEILEQVVETKKELEDVLSMLREDSTDIQNRLDEIMRVEEQLEYINMNIKTLETAIMCHETKIFEKRTVQGKIAVLCMN
jgi:flagellar biosynthesis/type III secretory pathway chaperone